MGELPVPRLPAPFTGEVGADPPGPPHLRGIAAALPRLACRPEPLHIILAESDELRVAGHAALTGVDRTAPLLARRPGGVVGRPGPGDLVTERPVGPEAQDHEREGEEPESRPGGEHVGVLEPAEPGHFLLGVGLLALGLFGILFPAVQYDSTPDARLAVVLVPALVVLAGFVAWERGPARRHGHPLIDVTLFRFTSYTGGLVVALLYATGAHGIMTLNDFKAIEGDRRMGIRSLPVQLGAAAAARVACAAMLLPQVVVVLLLADWGRAVHAGAVAVLALTQLCLMPRLLRDPRKEAPWYNASGTSLYVLGMLVSAFAVRSVLALLTTMISASTPRRSTSARIARKQAGSRTSSL